jgi:general secretion pathway protein L
LIAPDRNSLDQFTSTLVAQGLNAKLAQVNSNEQGQFSGQVTVNVVENDATQTNVAAS